MNQNNYHVNVYTQTINWSHYAYSTIFFNTSYAKKRERTLKIQFKRLLEKMVYTRSTEIRFESYLSKNVRRKFIFHNQTYEFN